MPTNAKELCRDTASLEKFLAKLPFKNKSLASAAILAMAKDPLSLDAFCDVFTPLVHSLTASPDPDMAMANLERFTGAIFSRSSFYGYLKSRPGLLDLLTKLFGSSQFLSDALVRNPEYLDWLSDTAVVDSSKDKEEFLKELNQMLKLFPKKDSKMDVLRRFKRREMLRIGVRDILGSVSLEITVVELSHLADALVEAALAMACAECREKYGEPMDDAPDGKRPARFCVIGMGKLGGLELNYSSDIDVIFLYSGEGSVKRAKEKAAPKTTHEFFNRVAENILHILGAGTKEGYVFRMDTRLRPEGETGPLARSLESYETYYATWGEAWEKLALIKARPIAGDSRLGEDFMAMRRPFVYQRHLGPWEIEEIRHIKKRMESRLAQNRTTFTEVKLGYGGIREIEFSIQLLQLIHGAQGPALQDANSLRTIDALARANVLNEGEDLWLKEAYRFLRRVEHFLQIVHELQVHQLPMDAGELEKLAKRMGYKNAGRRSALARFQGDFTKVTKRVHEFHVRIFGGDRAGDSGLESLSSDQIPWANCGFKDPAKAAEIMKILAHGPSYMHLSCATVREFMHLVPRLIALLKDSPDPDTALNAFERMVAVQGARTGFYKLLEANPKLLELMIAAAGTSRDLSETLVQHPEFLESLTRDPFLAKPKGPDEYAVDLQRATSSTDHDASVRRFKKYEMLRIGLRDLLGLAGLSEILKELSDLADAIAQDALRGVAKPSQRSYAILALGKWGSGEMGYYSDLDALFVHDVCADKEEALNKAFQGFIAALSENTPDGFLYKVDARLRPGGKNDVLALPLEGYRQYYTQRIRTWEKQALTRLRFIGGDQKLGGRFIRMVEGQLFCRGLSATEVQELQAMRERMTKEKVPWKHGGEQKGGHVKLDAGGIVDVEFTAQLLQLHWGWKYPALRHGTTLEILDRAGEMGLLSESRRKVFYNGYVFLRAIENKIRMVSGIPTETIVGDQNGQYAMVRRLGYAAGKADKVVGAFWEKYRTRTLAIRESFEDLCAQAKKDPAA